MTSLAEPRTIEAGALPSQTAKGGARRGRAVGQLGMGPSILISLIPAVLLFLVFFAIPLVVLVATAFTHWSGRNISFAGLDNFVRVTTDPVFWKAARNTVFYAAAGILVQVPLGTFVGIVLASKPRGWRIMRTAVFIPYMISGAAIAMVFTVVYNPRYGLLNQILESVGLPSDIDWLFTTSTARWAVAATFAFTVGFAAVLVSAEMASISPELYEAAELDGAGLLRRHLYISLPLLRNVIGTLVLLSVIGSIASFEVVYILTSGGPADSTSTLMVYAYRSYIKGDWGLANAIGSTVVVLGLFLIVGVRKLFRIGEAE